jgi:release factor glutamine methyltransferase
LGEKEGGQFREKILRRAEQEPVAYLVGDKEFWSLNFKVNPQVLIPRPETEMLVEEALKVISTHSNPLTLVELGTGSGAVAVALAKSLKPSGTIRLIATDISTEALNTARQNAAYSGVEKSIQWVQGNWLKPFSSRSRWVDLLISNPPYISDSEMDSLPKTVKKYEPLKALSGGKDGLEAFRQIFKQAVPNLKIEAWMLLEIGETQGPELLALAKQNGFNPITILRDYNGKDRVLKACYHG